MQCRSPNFQKPSDRVLVVVDGDIGGAVNLTREIIRRDAQKSAGAEGSVVYGLLAVSSNTQQSLAGQAQIDRLGATLAVRTDDPSFAALAAMSQSQTETRKREVSLVHARWIAEDLGCDRVVWFEHMGGDLGQAPGSTDVAKRLVEIADTALLITHLGLIGTPETPPVSATVSAVREILRDERRAIPPIIEVPLATLDDTQLASLALDVDAPLDLVWWNRSNDGIAAEARRRWSSLRLIESYN